VQPTTEHLRAAQVPWRYAALAFRSKPAPAAIRRPGSNSESLGTLVFLAPIDSDDSETKAPTKIGMEKRMKVGVGGALHGGRG
jgi:hypothetical protein